VAKPKTTIWQIDQHTKAKHRILRQYLQAWLPIVGSRYPRIRLIDGFAGPGQYAGGEPGSPIIMLQAFLQHASRSRITASVEYVFIEERADRYDALCGEIEKLGRSRPLPSRVTIDKRNGSFDAEMPSVAAGGPPTFTFIDPFGWSDAPMTLSSNLLRVDHCEALIYVPLPFIARFVNDANVEGSLTTLYGDDSWKAACTTDSDECVRVLRSAFEDAMLKHCRYVRAFDICPDGSRGYTLFFGTRHPLGLRRMKEVMWDVDPAGGCRYVDVTNPDQEILFELEPDVAPLEAMLRTRFAAGVFTIKDAEDCALFDTPFVPGHVKKRTLKPAEAAGRLEVLGAPAGRRAGTYPAGTRMHFVS
jgi:three-Cys-motif partner protein